MKFFLILLFFISCSQIKTLNLQEHSFNISPKRIIWFQIAGLSEEHLAMLKFSYANSESIVSFERAKCLGSTWVFDTNTLRPSAFSSFTSQITGNKNSSENNRCQLGAMPPIWSYLAKSNFNIGIFETSEVGKKSIINELKCNSNEKLKGHLTVWRMAKTENKNAKFFHQSEKMKFPNNEIYYDRSCQKGDCYFSVTDNLKSVFSRYTLTSGNKYLFLIRDYTYLNTLKNSNLKKTKEILKDLEQALSYFLHFFDGDQDTLILVTSAESIKLDFPSQGKEWLQFDRQNKNMKFGKPSLISPVWAFGAGAENFCGMYETAEILYRIAK